MEIRAVSPEPQISDSIVHPADSGASAGRAVLAKIDIAISSLDKYYVYLDKKHNGQFNEIGCEVRKRVCQTALLLKKVIDLLLEHSDIAKAIRPPWEEYAAKKDASVIEEWQRNMQTDGMKALSRRDIEIVDELTVFTESAYWIAARARGAIRLLPSLEKFEAKGVRNVRNKLLEHPEKNDSGVMINSFAFGGSVGPVVKGVRYDNQADLWVDEGLFTNLNEFADKIIDAIGQVLP